MRTQLQHQPPSAPWQPRQWHAPGVLGPRPNSTPQQDMQPTDRSTPCSHNITSAPPTPVYNGNQQYVDPALLQALNNMHLPGNQEWFMDIGASSHMSSDHGIISSFKPASQTVMVGNGQSIPATHIGSQIIPLPPDHFLPTIFLSFPTLSKTLFLFANSQLTTIVQLNLILLVFP